MATLKTMAQALKRGFINAGRTRARQDLLARGDRFLADNGFSRELLESGNAAWPWRLDDDTGVSVIRRDARPDDAPVSLADEFRERRLARAAAELAGLDDADLADLGIVRADIDRVVRHGRAGVEPVAGRTGAPDSEAA